jgi:hypothetical protein
MKRLPGSLQINGHLIMLRDIISSPIKPLFLFRGFFVLIYSS